jgi:hypothetical protein
MRPHTGTLTAVFAGACLVILAVTASAATPPFTQCPAIGADTSCGILITINANGSVSVDQDATQPPYDSIEDTLVGVQNNSTQTIPSLHVTGSANPEPPFGFDGDGLCTFGVSGCPFGPTGYEGPNTSFANIAADLLSGDVVFTGGLSPGGSAYFSLEGAISAQDLIFNTPPDCSQASVSPNTLWPPNHELRNVTISGVTDPDAGDQVTINVTAVTQDEPTNGLGDGDTATDAVITANSNVVQIRAERSGTGDGRVYVINFTGTDTSGATCQGTATVTVVHDQKPGHGAVNSGQNYISTQ